MTKGKKDIEQNDMDRTIFVKKKVAGVVEMGLLRSLSSETPQQKPFQL